MENILEPTGGSDSTLRILHLEDCPPDALLIRLAIESADPPLAAEVRVVETREDYEAALKAGCIDLILCDYRIPSCDGDQALRAAMAQLPDVPFIMVTGELGEDRAIETLKNGATDYVLKDNLRRLVPAMRRALRDAALLRKHREDEEALRSSEKRLQDMIRFAPTFIYEIDFRGPRFLSVNEAMCAFSGFSREELLGMNPLDLLSPASQAAFRRRMEQWLRGEKPDESVEYRAHMKSGEERWVVLHVNFTCDEAGRPRGAQVIGHDVTERKNMEEGLRHALQNLHALVEAAPRPIMVVNGEGFIEAINAVGAELIGSREAELKGAHVLKFTLPFSRMEMDMRLDELRRLAPLPVSMVLRVMTASGGTQWVTVEATLLKSEFGEEKYLVRFERLDLGFEKR